MISRKPIRLVRKTARPRMLARADSGKEDRIHSILRMEITGLTPQSAIKQAIAGFASERIAAGNRKINRSEFVQLIKKFSPHHIEIRTMLKRYGLEVEKAPRPGRTPGK